MLSKAIQLLSVLTIINLAAYALEIDHSWDLVYDEAVELLLHGKNPGLAEKKLLIALRQEPNDQHNKRLTYGNRRVNYYPNYFLGLAYFEQKKWNEAATQFKTVLKSGIFEQRDPKYVATFSSYKVAIGLAETAANDDLKIKERISTVKNLLQSNQLAVAEKEIELLKKADSDNQEILGLVTQLHQQQAEKLLEQAQNSFQHGQYTDAAKALEQAQTLVANHRGIAELSEKISTALKDSLRTNISERLLSEAVELLSIDRKKIDINDSYFSEIRSKITELQSLGASNDQLNNLLLETQAAEEQYSLFLLEQARKAISKKNYQIAEEVSLKMIRMKLDTSAAQKVLREIDSARRTDEVDTAISQNDLTVSTALQGILKQNGVRVATPKPAVIIRPLDENAQSTTLTLAKRDADENFNRALLSFLKADYATAINRFAALEQTNPSAKVHFYLGCALAGLGFINGNNGDYLLMQAKEKFSKVPALDSTFKPHLKYISPRIVQFYKQIEHP